MAYQKLQVSEALAVIPSNTVAIPDPSTKVLMGVGDFSVGGVLTDVGTTFLTDGIQIMSPGPAIIYNTTDSVAYYVLDITDDLNLSITNVAGGSAAASYTIYNAATIGCVVYVGGAGDMKMVMANTNFPQFGGSGASVAFQSIPAGSFLPTQIIGVAETGTTATDIVALW
tara:strand:- start:92 stop:601 length:510 start_codon:yes stop_codon:yes gene_type:complete